LPIQETPASTSGLGSFLDFTCELARGLAAGSGVISLRVSTFSGAGGRALAAELAKAKQKIKEIHTQAISTIAITQKPAKSMPLARGWTNSGSRLLTTRGGAS
jgi:hypothetical protein